MNLRKRIAITALTITAIAGIAAPAVGTSHTTMVAGKLRCC